MGKVFDRLWDKAGKHRVPLTGAFELLPTCNLSCKMCYVRKDMSEVQAAGGLMSTEFWLDIAEQAKDCGLLLPLLTGGEPFMRQDIQTLMAKMLEMGLQISLNSNATLIDESMAKWLGRYRPTRINVTLYGASEETYEQLCGNGDAYNRVRRAVDWLKYYDVPVKFNASITQYNMHDLDEIVKYAKSVGSPVQVATYMFPPVRRSNDMIGKNDRMTPDQAARAKVRADWLQQEPAWFKAQAERYSHFVPLTKEMLEKQSLGAPHEMSCRAGRCSFWVDWQGNLGNCGMNTIFKHDLKARSFSEAWKDIVAQTDSLRFSSVCTNCPNFRLCHSCVAMVLNETGSLDGRPEYLCEMNALSAKYYQEYAQMLPDITADEREKYLQNMSDICDI